MRRSLKLAQLLLSTFTPQRRSPDPRHAIPERDKDLSDSTIVFTGGTDGMGRVAVEMLAAMGARVVLVARSEEKARALIGEVERARVPGTVEFTRCDLSSLDDVRERALRTLADHKRIDVLVNCAGANFQQRSLSADGFEMNWAVNYLALVLLTRLLLDRLNDSAPSRIVNISSDTEAVARIDLQDL